MAEFFLPVTVLPTNFVYPLSFRLVVERGLLNWEPWQFLEGQPLLRRHEGLTKRYPGRSLVPFARRLDRDDIACWDSDRTPGTISVIEDFAPAGFEQTNLLESFGDWLRLAVADMVDFED